MGRKGDEWRKKERDWWHWGEAEEEKNWKLIGYLESQRKKAQTFGRARWYPLRVYIGKHLLRRNLNLARLNVVGDVLGAAAIDLAAGGESGTENLLDGTLELLGHGLVGHDAGNGDDLVKRDGLGVLDVLLLLAVTRRLLEGLDDEGRSGRNDGYGCLTVLDGQLDRDAESLPVTRGLGDIFTDLLWRQTERTDLGGERG